MKENDTLEKNDVVVRESEHISEEYIGGITSEVGNDSRDINEEEFSCELLPSPLPQVWRSQTTAATLPHENNVMVCSSLSCTPLFISTTLFSG